MVEHDLAKVGVAGSSPVSRSECLPIREAFSFPVIFRLMLGRLLLNDKVILALIAINAAALFAVGFPGLPAGVRMLLHGVDDLITILFVLEAVVKMRRFGVRGYFRDGWNRFDLALVTLALPSLADLFMHVDMDAYGTFLVLRAVRVVKLLRTIRFFPNINGLVKGVERAVKASFVVVVAFAIALFIVALFTQRIFATVSPDHFGDPVRALYSVFKIFTVEGWFDIPDEVVADLPAGPRMLARLWFIAILMGGGIFGLSLVNSIFVDAMVADNNDALEAKIDALTTEVRRLQEMVGRNGPSDGEAP